MSRAVPFALALCLVLASAGACTPDHELSDTELYSKYCSECHGVDGRGDESLLDGGQEVNLLASRYIGNGDREFVRRRIAYGYGQMPAYRDKVDPETLERLVELTMRLAQKDEGSLDAGQKPESATPEDRPDNESPEDGNHGPTTSESGVSEARSAR